MVITVFYNDSDPIKQITSAVSFPFRTSFLQSKTDPGSWKLYKLEFINRISMMPKNGEKPCFDPLAGISEPFEIVEVDTGMIRVGGENIVLRSNSIGSCIVLVTYDPEVKIGGMAHIMLPGKAPDNYSGIKTRYAEEGIERLLSDMGKTGSRPENIRACMVGGANVLRREDDTIADENIKSTTDILTARNIPIEARSVGGYERRTISFMINESTLWITIAESPREKLHEFGFKREQRGISRE